MKVFKWLVASAVLCISSTLVAGELSRVTVSHFEPLQRLSMQSDAAMLAAVGSPVAVNPSRRLTRLAMSRGWDVRSWQ